jgi:hypothetical protein
MGPESPDINAGAWYLRGTGEGSWEVCEPVTGEVRATVSVTGEAAAAGAGAEAVGRFLLQLLPEPGQGAGQ